MLISRKSRGCQDAIDGQQGLTSAAAPSRKCQPHASTVRVNLVNDCLFRFNPVRVNIFRVTPGRINRCGRI